jgi:hypothetical protein
MAQRESRLASPDETMSEREKRRSVAAETPLLVLPFELRPPDCL